MQMKYICLVLIPFPFLQAPGLHGERDPVARADPEVPGRPGRQGEVLRQLEAVDRLLGGRLRPGGHLRRSTVQVALKDTDTTRFGLSSSSEP